MALAAQRVAERKVIRAGIDAWQAIGKADNFNSWKSIGAALSIGKAHALRVTGANRALGAELFTRLQRWSVAGDAKRARPAAADASLEQRPPMAKGYSTRIKLTLMLRRPPPLHGFNSGALWINCQQIKPRRCGETHRRKRLYLFTRTFNKAPPQGSTWDGAASDA